MITLVPPADLRFWFYWTGPLFVVIHGSIGLIFAKAWHNLTFNICDNALHLITVAFLSLVIGFLLPTIWVSQLVYSWMTEIWMNAFILNNFHLIIIELGFLPGLLVLVSGGGVQFYKIIRKDPIDVPPAPPPRGVRTSHFLLTKALHKEQDRFRDTDS